MMYGAPTPTPETPAGMAPVTPGFGAFAAFICFAKLAALISGANARCPVEWGVLGAFPYD